MTQDTPSSMDPNALPLDDAARLLTKAGGRLVTDTMLHADVEAGAPTNPDGTLSLVHYAAWLVKDRSRNHDGH